MEKCLIKDCERIAVTRGLSQHCYVQGRKLVREGKTTWDDLISKGMATKSKRQTKEDSLFMLQFNSKK